MRESRGPAPADGHAEEEQGAKLVPANYSVPYSSIVALSGWRKNVFSVAKPGNPLGPVEVDIEKLTPALILVSYRTSALPYGVLSAQVAAAPALACRKNRSG